MLVGQGVIVALLDSLTGTEVIVILVIALIVLGPDKLPGVARQAGRWFNQLRDLTSNLQNEVRDVLDDPTMQPLKELGEFAAQPRRKLAEYARQAALEAEEEEAGKGSEQSSGTSAEKGSDDATGEAADVEQHPPAADDTDGER